MPSTTPPPAFPRRCRGGGLGRALVEELHELRRTRIVEIGRVLLEDRRRERVLRLEAPAPSGRAPGTRSVQRRRVVDLFIASSNWLPSSPIAPTHTRSGFASFTRAAWRRNRGSRNPIRGTPPLQPALFHRLAGAERHEVDRRKLAGHDRDGFRRLRRRGESIEQRIGKRRRRVGAQRPRRKVRVVLGEARNAERVMDEDLVVALRDAHCREDRAGGVRTHQEIDLVDGDELFVERPREVGLRLIVLDDPLDRAAEQSVLLVDLFDVDLAHELVDERRGRERPRQRRRAADADRRAGRRRGRAGHNDERKRARRCSQPGGERWIS